MAAHTTTRSRAIGSSFVVPKNPAIRKSDSVAPPIASTLHQPNGTQNPTTARAARINTTAALPARKTPEIGYSPDAGIRPNSPPSPIDQGQAHLNRPPNVSWASLSKGTRYEAAKWACSTRSAAKSHFDIVVTSRWYQPSLPTTPPRIWYRFCPIAPVLSVGRRRVLRHVRWVLWGSLDNTRRGSI